jgi:hypothetical protein
MPAKTAQYQPKPKREPDAREAVDNSDRSNDEGRDLVRSEGGAIGLPEKPRDISKDDSR